MCSTDFEQAKVWNVTRPVARKPHKCIECHLPVRVGEPYERINSFLDSWLTQRRHVACAGLSDFVRDQVCMVQEKREHSKDLRGYPSASQPFRFDGAIPVGELAQEIHDIGEYEWELSDDDDRDCEAMGFVTSKLPHEDDDEDEAYLVTGPALVVGWLWELIREEYKEDAR